jgi:hypothetical protein
VVVPANVEWVDTGIDVRASVAFFLTMSASGHWTNTAGGQQVGAAGYGSLILPNAIAPAVPFASLIGRIDGAIFGVGENFRKRSPATGRLFLAMNDVAATFGDNSGELTVVIDRPANPAVSSNQDPLVFLDLLSADPQPFFAKPSFQWTLRNQRRPAFGAQLIVFLDGLQASTEPAPGLVLDLAPDSERSGTFTLNTGINPVLPAGDHTVKIEVQALTPNHEVLASRSTSVTSFVPNPPPSIAITKFKTSKDYQDQGKEVELSWEFQATNYCMPADLVLKKKDYLEPEVMLLQEASPSSPGAQKVVIKATSSPLTYVLSVGCKFTSAGQTIPGTTVPKEVKVAFGPLPPPAAPNVLWHGAFFTPTTVIENQSFIVSWSFWNAGGAKSSEFDVQLYLDGVKEGEEETVPELEPGKSKNMDWPTTKKLLSGSHAVELKRVADGSSLDYRPFNVSPP